MLLLLSVSAKLRPRPGYGFKNKITAMQSSPAHTHTHTHTNNGTHTHPHALAHIHTRTVLPSILSHRERKWSRAGPAPVVQTEVAWQTQSAACPLPPLKDFKKRLPEASPSFISLYCVRGKKEPLKTSRSTWSSFQPFIKARRTSLHFLYSVCQVVGCRLPKTGLKKKLAGLTKWF